MDVLHNFEEVEGEAYMNPWAIDELIQRVIIELFNEMA